MISWILFDLWDPLNYWLFQVNKRCRFLLDFEQEVRRVLENLKPSEHPFGGQNVDASSLGWAMSAVSSRAFRVHGKSVTSGDHDNIPMMLPLIDMCNHSFDPNARIVQEQDAENRNFLVKVCNLNYVFSPSPSLPLSLFSPPPLLNSQSSWAKTKCDIFLYCSLTLNQVVAETAIKQNDPLVLNYGCLNNDLFLLDYGFVIPSNPYDNIELKYDGALLDAASLAAGVVSPNFSSPSQWQQKVLCQLNLDGVAPLLKVFSIP